VSNRNDKEAVAGVSNTGQGVVPGQESGEQCKESTSLDDALSRVAGRVADEVTDTKQQEGEIQREEEGEERDGGSQGANQKDEGKDEPALPLSACSSLSSWNASYHQEDTQRVIEHGRAAFIGRYESGLNIKSTGGEDDGESNPETTIRRQSSGTKRVSNGHFPVTKSVIRCLTRKSSTMRTTCRQAAAPNHHIQKQDQ
jgi:hypothetical protein